MMLTTEANKQIVFIDCHNYLFDQTLVLNKLASYDCIHAHWSNFRAQLILHSILLWDHLFEKAILCSGTSHFVSWTCYRHFWPCRPSDCNDVLRELENPCPATPSANVTPILWHKNAKTRSDQTFDWVHDQMFHSITPLHSSVLLKTNNLTLEFLLWGCLAHVIYLFLMDALSSGKQNKKRRALHWHRSDKFKSSNVEIEGWWADLQTPFPSDVIFVNLEWSNVGLFPWEVDLCDALRPRGPPEPWRSQNKF